MNIRECTLSMHEGVGGSYKFYKKNFVTQEIMDLNFSWPSNFSENISWPIPSI